MADDCVPASPIALKAKKRKGGLLKRKAKRHRGKSEKVADEASKTANDINTTMDSVPGDSKDETGNVAESNNLDITALYWPESEGETSKDLQDIDLFYEARILEQANQVPVEVTNKIPAELVKGNLISLDILSQQIKPQQTMPPPVPAKITYETQFVTETEMLRACEVVDAISDLHHNIPKFSQWNSPASSPAPLKTFQSPAKMETDSSGQKQTKPSSKNCAESTPYVKGISQKPGTSYARKKYDREIEKAARKRINFFDDSDSKSSLSSELSLQSNEGIQFTPLDEVDLNKSFHVHENIHNLSSFFSQSFVQDDVDNTTNGIFRYIMLMKSKRKNVKMIHWFRSGKNFAVNETWSSKSFKGFSKSEKSTSNIESSREDIRELLDEDEDFFKDLTKEKDLGKQSAVAEHIESILKNADRVLEEVSEFDTNIEDEINKMLQPKSTQKENDFIQGFNMNTLLHGKIIETPKMNRFSESSIADSSPWIMRPKVQNSITASDIEFDSEPKNEETPLDFDSPHAFDTTFIIPKTPETIEKTPTTTNKITSVGDPQIRNDLLHKELVPLDKAEEKILRDIMHLQTNEFTFKDDFREEMPRELKSKDTCSLNNNYKHPFQDSESTTREKPIHHAPVLEKEGNTSSECSKANPHTLISKTLPKQFNTNISGQFRQEAASNCNRSAEVNNLTTGFTTAGGKNLFVSSAGQMRALQIQSEIDNDGKQSFRNFDRATCEKSVHISGKSVEKRYADESLLEIEEKRSSKLSKANPQTLISKSLSKQLQRNKTSQFKQPGANNCNTTAKVTNLMTGFTTAGGKNLFVSSVGQKRAMQILSEIDKDDGSFDKSTNQRFNETIEKTTKTTSKTSSVESLTRNDLLSKDLLPLEHADERMLQEKIELLSNQFTFKDDFGKKLQREFLSNEASTLNNNNKPLQISENKLAFVDTGYADGSLFESNAGTSSTFSKSNLSPSISKTLPQQLKRYMMTESRLPVADNCIKHGKENNLMTGFTTAGGKNLFVSSAGQMKALQILSEIDEDDGSFSKGFNKIAEKTPKTTSSVSTVGEILPIDTFKDDFREKFHREPQSNDVSILSNKNPQTYISKTLPKQFKINKTTQFKQHAASNSSMSAKGDNLMTGFATAGGKNLFVSSAGQMRALQIQSEIDTDDRSFDESTNKSFKEKLKNQSITHSTMDLSKITNHRSEDKSKNYPPQISISRLPQAETVSKRGFFVENRKRESNKVISISTELEKKVHKIGQEVINDLNDHRAAIQKSVILNISKGTGQRNSIFSSVIPIETGSSRTSETARLEQEKENHPLSKSAKLWLNNVRDNLDKGFVSVDSLPTFNGKEIYVSKTGLERPQVLREEVNESTKNHQSLSVVNPTHNFNAQPFANNVRESKAFSNEFNKNSSEEATAVNAAQEFDKTIENKSFSVVDVTHNFNANSITDQRPSTSTNFPQTDPLKLPVVGFQSASGKTIKVSKKALALAEKKMAEDDDDILSNLKLSQINCSVAVTNENVNIALKNTSVQRDVPALSSPVYAKRLLRSNSIENKRSSSTHTPTRAHTARPVSPLVTSKRVLRSNSIEARPSPLTGSFTTPGRVQSPLTLSPIIDSTTPQRSSSDIAPARSRLSLSSKRFKPPSNVADKPVTPIRPIPLHLHVQTPNLQEFFNSVDTSTPKNIGKSKSRSRFTLSQEVSASTAALLEDEADISDIQTAVEEVKWKLKEEKLKEDLKSTNIAIRASDDNLNERMRKRAEQESLIQNKTGFQGIVQGGELFVKKTNRNRMKLRDLVKNSNKSSYTPISTENILNHKFPASIGDVSIATEDGSFIVPDDQSCIGFEEIKNAFLSLPSVAPSLIPVNWTQHHYKMIFLKLNWLNTISPSILEPRNICLQLKYRYDHELDRAHRSILRKILECDESPAKRMVLSVLAIHNTGFNMEIELSDRWYSVKTTIDSVMQSLVDSGKVKVGTKLMIQSAELLNCEEGCDALAIPTDVRLKIHTNSTRRAKWDTKLGLYKVQTPFLINLKQVDMNGKMVTRLEVYILRIYPSLFMREGKENGNVSEFHSEKVEKQLRQHEDVSKLSNIEAIFSQVQKEIDKEERESSSKRYRSKRNIKNISDPAELYELIRWEGDTSEIEAELSCVQRSLLANYQQQIYADRMQKVQKRVQTKLQKQSTPSKPRELFKIRVIDYRDPTETAIISIWNPDPEIKNLLQEHTALEVTHLIPKDIHSYELQLTSTKLTQYKVLQGGRNQRANQKERRHPIPEHYFRHVSSIQEIYSPKFKPAFNEFDTCGLIVMIGDGGDSMQGNQAKRFQPVYMSDLEENILCLNFWIGIKDYGYEDVIQIHRFVAANNLQWRSNSASGHIRTAFVTSTSTFTEKPRNQDMIHALDALQRQFHSKYGDSTSEFVERCRERIKEIKSRPKAVSTFNASHNMNNTNNLSMNSLASTSMNASTSLNNSSTINRRISVQERIEKLNMSTYGCEPPDLTPVRMKCTRSVRKSFKVPTRIKDDSVS